MSNLKALPPNGRPVAVSRTTGRGRPTVQLAVARQPLSAAGEDLLNFADGRRFGTILADPPWQFQNRTGKVAPEHKRLARYGTMTLDEIITLQP